MQSKKITILQINDTHGYLEPHPELFRHGPTDQYRTSGGFARLLTIFKQVRLERPGAVIALDNGDTARRFRVIAGLRGAVVLA